MSKAPTGPSGRHTGRGRNALGREEWIAIAALAAIAAWGGLTLAGFGALPVARVPWTRRPLTVADMPLVGLLVVGGGMLVWDLLAKVMAGTFGSDLLAGISIVTSLLLGEYLAGCLVVLMLSGGEALEARAVSRAGDVLDALARRMPALAHRRLAGGL